MADTRAADRAVRAWLKERDENIMMETFTNLVAQFGLEVLQAYADPNTKHRHTIVHTLTKQGKAKVLQHLVNTHHFDINVPRPSDKCTPLHLAFWNENVSLADELIRLGADGSLLNQWGEPAGQERFDAKPIGARLQGAQTSEQVLQLVESDLRGFTDQELAQAYYLLGTRTADYDPVHCTFTPKSQNHIFDDPRFARLANACEAAVRRTGTAEAVALWATFAWGLVKLPHQGLIGAFRDAVQSFARSGHATPFEACTSYVLVKLAWCFAKLVEDDPAHGEFFRLLGDSVAGHVDNLKCDEVASLLWSCGKSGTRHEPLLRALCKYVKEHAADFAPAWLSIAAWAFAKLGCKDYEALMAVSRAVKGCVMDDQGATNVMWAFAKLTVADEELYRACFERASETLYGKYRFHAKKSEFERIMQWAQSYRAYSFCLQHCPGAVHGLKDPLASDLAQMHRRQNGETSEVFSTGSGLGTSRALRDLDRLIENMVGDAPESDFQPLDSLEADSPGAGATAEVANASVSDNLLRGRIGPSLVNILEFSRSIQEYRTALMEHPELEQCRRSLQDHGFGPELPSGAKVFVHPEQYNDVVAGIRREGLRLRPWHVVVAADLEEAVMSAVGSLRSSLQVRLKTFRGHALQDYALAPRAAPHVPYVVKRTFIELDSPAAAHSGSQRAAQTA